MIGLLLVLGFALPQSQASPERVSELIQKLEADTLSERENAEEKLLAIGKAAVPALRKAAEPRFGIIPAGARNILAAFDQADTESRVAISARLLEFSRSFERGDPDTCKTLVDEIARTVPDYELLPSLRRLASGQDIQATSAKTLVSISAISNMSDGALDLYLPGRKTVNLPSYSAWMGMKAQLNKAAAARTEKLLDHKVRGVHAESHTFDAIIGMIRCASGARILVEEGILENKRLRDKRITWKSSGLKLKHLLTLFLSQFQCAYRVRDDGVIAIEVRAE